MVIHGAGRFYQSQYAQNVAQPAGVDWKTRLHGLLGEVNDLKDGKDRSIQHFFKVEDKLFDLGKNVIDQDPSIDERTKKLFWETYDSCIHPLEYVWEIDTQEWNQFKQDMLSSSQAFFNSVANASPAAPPASQELHQKVHEVLNVMKEGNSPAKEKVDEIVKLTHNDEPFHQLAHGLSQIWDVKEPATVDYTKEKIVNFMAFCLS